MSSKCFIIFQFFIQVAISQKPFSLKVDDNGRYSLYVNGNVWLDSAPTFFRDRGKLFSTGDGTLKLFYTGNEVGVDKLGNFTTKDYLYRAGSREFFVSIRQYDDPNFLVFVQNYTDGASATKANSFDEIISGFPGFQIQDGVVERGYLSYGGYMLGDTHKVIGKWGSQTEEIRDGLSGGPLVIFDKEANTLIISPLTEFMTVSNWHEGGVGGNIYWGIMGGVNEVPYHYTCMTMVYYTKGINKAFEGWGKTLKKMYGSKENSLAQDLTLHRAGYWTDNGAYYYYKTEPMKNYEQTMMDLINKTIPFFNYFQFDSWWYYKGSSGGVKLWEPRNDIFPHGFGYFYNHTFSLLALHNRYWSKDTSYAKQNGGKYDFIVEDSGALPVEQTFWNDLLNKTLTWGLVMYEQDWLNVQLDKLTALKTNLTLGEVWLTQMNKAAKANNVYIQYCMANPRHALQSLTLSQVTQVRVSDDYSPGGEQWRIGVSSLLAYALGLAPSKDTFWTTEIQPGNRYRKSEPYTRLNALVATLSTGPYGPSDMLGHMDFSLINKSCFSYGEMTRPAKPATAMDIEFLKEAFESTKMETWSTYSINMLNNTALKWGTVLAVETVGDVTLQYNDLDFLIPGVPYALFSYDNPSSFREFNKSDKLVLPNNCTKTDFCLYHFVPKMNHGENEVYLLGDISKWLPAANGRIRSIVYQETDLLINLWGMAGEEITIHYVLNGEIKSGTCPIKTTGFNCISMLSGKCVY
ncbi:uncharacterized protein LOC125681238 isoform X4 [Ostrea edulis]|uniref:uncharacterized protein LOC125681238 isoform X4 n=1 Tax=Ostrea edulis TaxID=37623 RepID=UPI0024AF7607|nr:uncharacterized protein LOC125681238 isoform X4 [Ostrea edulis]